jgi:hypothetical protein
MTTEEASTGDDVEKPSAEIADGDFVGQAAAALKGRLPESLLLAQRLGPSPAPGQPRAYVPPTAGQRSETKEALHLRAIQDIAKARFAFPTEEFRDYKAFVNHPARTMGVQMADGAVAYPDIVVVQHPENNARILGEIETAETVGDAAARYEWQPFALLAPLYLYVPVGKGDDARELCKRYGVQAVGIRTWRYLPGYDEIEINDHS